MMSIYIGEIIRWLIALVLIAAALGKLKTFNSFRDNLVTSFALSPRFSSLLAPSVIAIELLIAVVLLANHFVLVAMSIVTLMLTLFTGVLAYRYIREGIIKCSCFGEAQRSVSVWDLTRNVCLISAAVVYITLSPVQIPLNGYQLFLCISIALLLLQIALDFHEIATLLFQSPS